MFSTDLPIATLTIISLSHTRLTSITFSIHLSATKIPTPDTPSSEPLQKNLNLAPSLPSNVLALPPFHLVSCKQQKSNLLLEATSATSTALRDIVPTFTVPTLTLTDPRQGFSMFTAGMALPPPLPDELTP